MSSATPDTHAPHGQHEDRDINLRPVVIAAVLMVIILIGVAVAMLGLYDVFAAREARLSPPENPLAAAEGPRLPPEPRLQVQPIRDLQELREAETKILDNYAWVDKSAGVVRIPIGRAIDLLAARAAPVPGQPK